MCNVTTTLQLFVVAYIHASPERHPRPVQNGSSCCAKCTPPFFHSMLQVKTLRKGTLIVYGFALKSANESATALHNLADYSYRESLIIATGCESPLSPMLALGFLSPSTAGPMISMLSRIQLCVRAAVRPTTLASTTRRGSRSVSNLRLDADGNISSNTRWSQHSHDCVCREKRSRGFSTIRGTGLWCTTTTRGAAFQREAQAEEKDATAEGEREGDGSNMFAVESISPSSVAAFKQCPRLFYYRWDLLQQFMCLCSCWHSLVAQ